MGINEGHEKLKDLSCSFLIVHKNILSKNVAHCCYNFLCLLLLTGTKSSDLTKNSLEKVAVLGKKSLEKVVFFRKSRLKKLMNPLKTPSKKLQSLPAYMAFLLRDL